MDSFLRSWKRFLVHRSFRLYCFCFCERIIVSDESGWPSTVGGKSGLPLRLSKLLTFASIPQVLGIIFSHLHWYIFTGTSQHDTKPDSGGASIKVLGNAWSLGKKYIHVPSKTDHQENHRKEGCHCRSKNLITTFNSLNLYYRISYSSIIYGIIVVIFINI